MHAYKINWLYLRTGHRAVPGHIVVLALSEAEARNAFAATHPACEIFRYKIIGVAQRNAEDYV